MKIVKFPFFVGKMKGSPREIANYPLAPSLKSKLITNGYRYSSDVPPDMRPLELSKDIGCKHEEALAIIRTINGETPEKNFGTHFSPKY